MILKRAWLAARWLTSLDATQPRSQCCSCRVICDRADSGLDTGAARQPSPLYVAPLVNAARKATSAEESVGSVLESLEVEVEAGLAGGGHNRSTSGGSGRHGG